MRQFKQGQKLSGGMQGTTKILIPLQGLVADPQCSAVQCSAYMHDYGITEYGVLQENQNTLSKRFLRAGHGALKRSNSLLARSLAPCGS